MRAALAWAVLSLLTLLSAESVAADPALTPRTVVHEDEAAVADFVGDSSAALLDAESSGFPAILPRETIPPGPTRPTGPDTSTEVDEDVSGTLNAHPILRRCSAPSAESRFAGQPLYCIHHSYLI